MVAFLRAGGVWILDPKLDNKNQEALPSREVVKESHLRKLIGDICVLLSRMS
jgi:hypothetical protein